jgi:hypothetical protein
VLKVVLNGVSGGLNYGYFIESVVFCVLPKSVCLCF